MVRMVRMVRSLADRTFQLRSAPAARPRPGPRRCTSAAGSRQGTSAPESVVLLQNLANVTKFAKKLSNLLENCPVFACMILSARIYFNLANNGKNARQRLPSKLRLHLIRSPDCRSWYPYAALRSLVLALHLDVLVPSQYLRGILPEIDEFCAGSKPIKYS